MSLTVNKGWKTLQLIIFLSLKRKRMQLGRIQEFIYFPKRKLVIDICVAMNNSFMELEASLCSDAIHDSDCPTNRTKLPCRSSSVCTLLGSFYPQQTNKFDDGRHPTEPFIFLKYIIYIIGSFLDVEIQFWQRQREGSRGWMPTASRHHTPHTPQMGRW